MNGMHHSLKDGHHFFLIGGLVNFLVEQLFMVNAMLMYVASEMYLHDGLCLTCGSRP
jgi:hypothetical protein